VTDETAPDLVGLHPDDAARACYAKDLDLVVENHWQMAWWGWDQPGARVAEQWPSPGSRMTSKTVSVRVEFVGGGGSAGVREPRRPSPPGRPLLAESVDEGEGD